MEKICAPLVRILQRGDSFSKSEAARALCSIAVNPDDRASVFASGAIGPLIALVAAKPRSPWARCYQGKCGAMATLYNLALDDHVMKIAIARAGAIRPLVMLLRSDNTDAKETAACLLRSLTNPAVLRRVEFRENKMAAMAARAVPALVEVVKSGQWFEGNRSKAAAAGALANLAWECDALIAVDTIVPLVDLLRYGYGYGSDDAKKEAARALGNLAQISDNRVAIAAAGAIPPLVAAETGSHAGAKKQAASALRNIAFSNVDNQVAIAEARAEALVRIARRSSIHVAKVGDWSSSSYDAREVAALLLAARRDVIIRKILEAALPPEIATSVVAPFLERWGLFY